MQPIAPPTALRPAGATAPPPGTVSPLAAIRFAFEGPDWTTTLLLGAVFTIIPIAGPIALMGFFCEVHQRLVARHPRPIPKLDFTDFGHYLGRGLVPFGVRMLIALPLSFVFGMLGVLLSVGVTGAVTRGIEPAIVVGAGVTVAAVVMVASLALAVVTNAAQTRAELTEDFAQALSFGRLMAYSGATWAVVMIKVFVYGFLAMFVGIAGMLILCVGVYPAMFVIQIGQLHLRWQIYERYRAEGGQEIPLKPPAPLPSEVQPHYGIG